MSKFKILNRQTVIALAIAAGVMASGEVSAHATYLQKDNYLTNDGRSYKEGKSVQLSLNLSHSCTADTSTVISTTVFPNGTDNEVLDLTLDSNLKVVGSPSPSSLMQSDVVTGDPITGIKPIVTHGDWASIAIKKDAAKKLRGIHWHDGWVPDDFYNLVSYKGTLAKINPTSCVTKVRVYIPAIQYCRMNAADTTFSGQDYWLWKAVPAAGIAEIAKDAQGNSVTEDLGRAPYIDIDRDKETNKLPVNCGGKGKVVGLYPSDAAIGSYLVHGGTGTGGGAVLKCADGSNANPPDHVTHHVDWCTDGSTPQ